MTRKSTSAASPSAAKQRDRAMKASHCLRPFNFEHRFFSNYCLAGLAAAGLGAATSHAAILASAQLTGSSLGHGEYAYTLTLTNTPASTSDISLFWFAWEAGQADFLASAPISVQTPTNWQAVVEGGGDDDGYSVQFITYTAPLAPGSSVTFTFKSTDSPKIMAAPAEFYPQYPTLTSQVYTEHAAAGANEVFLPRLVATDLGSLTPKASGGNLILNWTSGTNVALQQSSDFDGTNWTTVPGTLGKASHTVTNLPGNPATFYRLATQ